MVSKLSVLSPRLTVFESENMIAIGRQLLGIISNSFGRNTSMFWVTNSVTYRISNSRVSATRNIDLACKSRILSGSFNPPKIGIDSLVTDVRGVEVALSIKASQPVETYHPAVRLG